MKLPYYLNYIQDIVLTPEQANAIRKIVHEDEGNMLVRLKAQQQLRMSLLECMQNGQYEEPRARKLAMKLAFLEKENARTRKKIKDKINAILLNPSFPPSSCTLSQRMRAVLGTAEHNKAAA